MGNLHLVTGYRGVEHITSADHGSLYAAIFGNGSYVLNRGNKLAATAISSNTVRIADGDIILQGRHIRLNEGSSVDLSVENGSQGMKRNDLIVVRYTRSASTDVEDATLVVIKGVPAASSPADPAYNEADLLTDRAEVVDFPLYRIPLDGITVGELVPLFDAVSFVKVGSDGKIDNSHLPSMNYIPTSKKGAKNGVAPLGADSKVPSENLPAMNYIPYSEKNARGGVPSLNTDGLLPGTLIDKEWVDITSAATANNKSGQATATIKRIWYKKIGCVVFVIADVTFDKDASESVSIDINISGLPTMYGISNVSFVTDGAMVEASDTRIRYNLVENRVGSSVCEPISFFYFTKA